MRVILTEQIKGLGAIGDIVSVKDGYGRNYLIPQNRAVVANPANIADIEANRADLEKREQQRQHDAQVRLGHFKGMSLSIACQASEEGKLYGAVSSAKVLELIKSQGHDVRSSEIEMPSESIRNIGDYEVTLHFYQDVSCVVPLTVVAQ
jgi:large subunit ribosomal protein L9